MAKQSNDGKMRYWRLKGTQRAIAVDKDCQMSPRWEEIDEAAYTECKRLESVEEVIIGC